MRGVNPLLETDVLVEFVKEINPKSVLEVGCNYGRELKLLENTANLYGIDKSVRQINKARKYLPTGTFTVANGSKIPYDDNTFDLVYTVGCLSHNEESKMGKILDELLRVSTGYVLTIEWVGTKTSPTSYGNCKENTWIHDYERLWAVKNVKVCFNRKVSVGADLFHVMLVRKGRIFKKVRDMQKKPPRFSLHVWKFKFEVL